MINSLILLDSLAHATFLACMITAAIVFAFINKVDTCAQHAASDKSN